MSDLPFIDVPKLQASPLNKYDAVTTGKGTPSSQFQRWWQGIVLSLTKTIDALTRNQLIIQQQTDYLTEVSEWQQELQVFAVQRIAYLQLAVAAIAADTGTTLPDPSGLPPYPGPPPEPPF